MPTPPPSPTPSPAPFAALTVGVIHHRTPDVLLACLDHLQRAAPGATLLVVDTAPEPDLAARLRRAAPRVAWVPCVNHSLAHAANTVLKRAATPLVAHMNADVYVRDDTFARLLPLFDDPRVAMAGPTALTPAGVPQDNGPLYRRHHRRLARAAAGGAEAVEVPWLSGCLQLVRRRALAAVGGMDASLRFYNEDLEWCWRLRRAGFRCLLARAAVTHLGGAATPGSAHFLVEGYRGGMVVSRRSRPRWFRALHRAAVLAEAAARRRLDPDAERRRAYAAIFRMFARGAFHESPFGATLDECNPVFTELVGRP